MRFIHSNKQYIERTMYPINPYMNTPAVAPLTMEAFVAPANFDVLAQEVNIVQKLIDCDIPNKRYIYSISQNVAITNLSGGISYIYSETISGVEYTHEITSQTISWTGGSVNRWVITNNTNENVDIQLGVNVNTGTNCGQGATWLYIGNCTVNSILCRENTYLKYVHYSSENFNAILTPLAFYKCAALTGIVNIPKKVTIIGFLAFSECPKLTGKLEIHDQITNIDTSAFINCAGLSSLSIGKSLNFVNGVPFDNNKFLTIDIDPQNTLFKLENGIMFNYAKTDMFIHVKNIAGVIDIPVEVTSIRSDLFMNCNLITGITGMYGVTRINSQAFRGCTGLIGQVPLPSSLIRIDYLAFYQCTGLTSLVIPASLTYLGWYAFGNCPNIVGALSIPTTVTYIDSSNPWTGCSGFTELNLPSNYQLSFLTFNFSSNFSASSLNQSIINIASGSKTMVIGATNKARLLAAYPNAEANASARGITVN